MTAPFSTHRGERERTSTSSPGDPVAAYHAAVARLDALIQPALTPRDVSPATLRARAEQRLARVRRFLAFLGDPHLAYPVVHVGGTSGKGSTAIAVAAILGAAGHRVGLHTSPYLQAATEKVHVGGRLVAGGAFAALVDDVMAAADAWARDEGTDARLTYGEIWLVLTTLHFAREKVDVAVIEVGAGGRFDLTNVVSPAVSVITSVGLDHTETLGATIPEIAWHKAGIVKPGAPAVTAVTDPAAFAQIEREAHRAGSTLQRVIPGETFELLGNAASGTRWRERGPHRAGVRPFVTALPGRFQATNAALAVAAVRALGDRGLTVEEESIRQGLRVARLPGRTETMPGPRPPRAVLDGAHNPQKIEALVADLPAILGDSTAARPVILLAALRGKDVRRMVELLAPHAVAVIATAVPVLGKTSTAPDEVRRMVRQAASPADVLVEPDPATALAVALDRAAASNAPLLVTGSLYLVGAARSRWYPTDSIVRQRTPWPRSAPAATEEP